MSEVLVVGATGPQGRAAVQALVESGTSVAALVRDRSRGADLAALGVETRVGDLDDPRSLREACAGIPRVVVNLPLSFAPGVFVTRGRAVVDAANAAGAELIVHNLGICAAREDVGFPFFADLHAVADHALAGRAPAIVLRPPLYLDNALAPWTYGHLVGRGVFSYPVPAALPLPWLSHRNLGLYVAAALRRPDLAGRTLDISDPADVTAHDIAAAIGRAMGRPVAFEAISPAEFGARVGAVLGAEAAWALGGLYEVLNRDGARLIRATSTEGRETLAPALETLDGWATRAFATAGAGR